MASPASYVAFFTFMLATRTEGVLQRTPYTSEGDLIIGGLIPLHHFDDSTEGCGHKRDISALRLVEALVYAVNRVNQFDRLGGIKLGYEIYDTCSSSSETLKNALAFTPPQRSNNNVLGVVGPQRSSSSLMATKLLGLYNISTISYLSTSDELSNSDRYPYFLRMVPPDKFQINVIIDLIGRYDWTYVSFIYSDDSYGNNAKAEFLHQIEETDICIGYEHSIPITESMHSIETIIKDLTYFRNTTLMSVVILFIHNDMATNLFRLAHQAGLKREFIWIGSDGWGNYGKEPVRGAEEVAVGSFTIVPKAGNLANFSEYFRSISVDSLNPWLEDFREEVDACTISESDCVSGGVRPQFESLIDDAVEVMVMALLIEKQRFCEIPSLSKDDCVAKIIEDRRSFKDSLLKVSFVSSSNGKLKFDRHGDAIGRYDIKQFQDIQGNDYEFCLVGNWSGLTTDGHLNIEKVRWYVDESRLSEDSIPKSICNEPCSQREVTESRTGCCWDCRECPEEALVENNICVPCYDGENGKYMWPDENSTMCIPLKRIKTGDRPENIVIIAVSALGLLLEFVVVILFLKNFEKKLIRASSRELGFIIFFGVFLTYVSSILYSVQASQLCCIIVRVVPFLGHSLIFVSIATMIIRLHRIFQAGKRSTKRPQFISPVSQVIVALTLSVVPMIWSVIWVVVEPPKVHTGKVANFEEMKAVMDTCGESTTHLIGQLLWQLVLVLTCCFYAIRTRNLPANYNQSRFIAFTAFCSLVVFIAFTPAYFLSTVATAKNLYSALGGIILATVVLVLLFIVRLYAVYFVQEEKQQAVTTPQSLPTITDDELSSTTKSTMLKINNHQEPKATKPLTA